MTEQLERIGAAIEAYASHQRNIGGPWLDDEGLLVNMLADLYAKYGVAEVKRALAVALSADYGEQAQ